MGPKSFSFPELVAEWNGCHGAFYRLRENDFLWHQQKQSWLQYSLGHINGVPVSWATASPEGAACGISTKTLWVSLFGKVSSATATEFLAGLEAAAVSFGKTRLSLGGEEFHFLPGLPEADAKTLTPELTRRGYRMAECADFAGELRTPAIQTYLEESERLAEAGGWRLTTALSADEKAELGEFLRQNFSGRWEREYRFWLIHNETNPAFWNSLRAKDGSIAGFARLATRGQALAWCPGALRFPLSPGSGDEITDACLGPIGVADHYRGKGVGKILLGLSLELLFKKGSERLCIDWTNAYNYYKPLGLPAVRSYVSAWKDF